MKNNQTSLNNQSSFITIAIGDDPPRAPNLAGTQGGSYLIPVSII